MTGAAEDPLERVRLTETLHLWQRRRGHRSATDDILCAWAGLQAAPGARRVLDLGAGQGSVTLLLAGVLERARLVAVEVQPVSLELLTRNVADNGLAERIRVVAGDLRDVDLGARAPFDLVTGSPPFLKPGGGTLPRDRQRAAARFELRGGVESYCAAAARHLGPAGVVSLLMDGAQDTRCRAAIDAAGLTLSGRLAVVPRDGARVRYLVYAAGHGAPARPLGDRELTVRRADGTWTAAYEAVRAALDLPGARR